MVISAPVLMGPRSAEQGRARRRADRLCHIRALKNDRLRCEFVEVWRMHAASSLADDGVRAELIWKENQQIRLALEVGRLGTETGTKRQTSRSKRSRTEKSTTGESSAHRDFRKVRLLSRQAKLISPPQPIDRLSILHFQRVAGTLLPTMDLFRQLRDHGRLRISVKQIVPLVRICAKVVKLVLVFIAETELPTIR